MSALSKPTAPGRVNCPCWVTGMWRWVQGCQFHPVEDPFTLSFAGTRTQPDSVPNERPACWDLVIADMQARDAKGLATYKVRLQAFNERNSAVDFYQELLDAAVYFRQAMEERNELLTILTGLRDGFEGPPELNCLPLPANSRWRVKVDLAITLLEKML